MKTSTCQASPTPGRPKAGEALSGGRAPYTANEGQS